MRLFRFLPRDAMQAWYMMSSCVCLYVCPSVCLPPVIFLELVKIGTSNVAD